MSRGVSISQIDARFLGPNSPLLKLMRRVPRRDLEHPEQVKLFEWATDHERDYPELRWLFAVPNFSGRQGKRTQKHGARLKAEGRKPGVLDVWFPVRRGDYPGLVIEMKSGKNRPTKDQLEWIEHLKAQGWLVLVAWSADAAIEWLLAYLAGKRLSSWAA